MTDLNLSKAAETALEAYDSMPWGTTAHEDMLTAITAALPHILDALAEQAEADTVRFFPRESELCSDWLRAKAEEVRGA